MSALNSEIKKQSRRNRWLAIAALVAIIVILIPKRYARSGGFAGLEKEQHCQCLGFEVIDNGPSGCDDCFTDYYCVGIPHSCVATKPH